MLVGNCQNKGAFERETAYPFVQFMIGTKCYSAIVPKCRKLQQSTQCRLFVSHAEMKAKS